MLNIRSEVLKPLSEAVHDVPSRRQGKKAHPSTLYRWATSGLRGIRLETLKVGGTLCTSQGALQRFFEALSGECSADAALPLTDQTDVEAHLEAEGI